MGQEPIQMPVVTWWRPRVWSITSKRVPNSLLRMVDLPLDCGPMIEMMAYFCCDFWYPLPLKSSGPPAVDSLCDGACCAGFV